MVGLYERTMIRPGDDNAPDIIHDNRLELGAETRRIANPGVGSQGKSDLYEVINAPSYILRSKHMFMTEISL